MKTTIAIDVDLTLVDTLNPWLRWFEARTGFFPEEITYKMERYMREHINECPFNYWRDPDLYEGLPPLEGSVEMVKALHADDRYEVVFVTWSPNLNQIKAKNDWLAENYGEDIPVIHTEHKHLIDAHVLIDDNPEMVENFLSHKPGRIVMKYRTEVNQDWHPDYSKGKYYDMKDWSYIKEHFLHRGVVV